MISTGLLTVLEYFVVPALKGTHFYIIFVYFVTGPLEARNTAKTFTCLFVVSLSNTIYSPKVQVHIIPKKRWLRPDKPQHKQTNKILLSQISVTIQKIVHLI